MIPALVRKVYEAQQRGNKQILVWGDGGSVREFLYSKNVAQGTIIMETQFYSELEPVNIGTGYEIFIRDLITLIRTLMGYGGELVWETDKPKVNLAIV